MSHSECLPLPRRHHVLEHTAAERQSFYSHRWNAHHVALAIISAGWQYIVVYRNHVASLTIIFEEGVATSEPLRSASSAPQDQRSLGDSAACAAQATQTFSAKASAGHLLSALSSQATHARSCSWEAECRLGPFGRRLPSSWFAHWKPGMRS